MAKKEGSSPVVEIPLLTLQDVAARASLRRNTKPEGFAEAPARFEPAAPIRLHPSCEQTRKNPEDRKR